MFEQYQRTERSDWVRLLVFVSVVGILLSLGMCGLGFASGAEKTAYMWISVGLVVVSMSSVGFLIGLVTAIVKAIQSRGK